MHSREEEFEIEEVVQEIDDSINTDEFLASQINDEHSYKTEKKNYDYFRRGILSFLILGHARRDRSQYSRIIEKSDQSVPSEIVGNSILMNLEG
jgi:hypothetical protein